jgi:hypothetical protein
VRRIVLLIMVAFLVASAAALWASTYKAAEEMGDLTSGLPLTIAASAVSISASSVTPLAAGLVPPYISECPAAQLCPLPVVRIEFS